MSLVNIDLSGLGQPLIKLLEVISSGIGAIFESMLTRLMAGARADEIKKIAGAISETQGLPVTVEYKGGEITVVQKEPESQWLEGRPVAQRALTRLAYQEAKKQVNIERIAQQAYEELRHEEHVSEEPVDEDWISRFFDIAEHISSEEMQVLWGKILAGEVRKPKSYSLRTLDTLKNITTDEALAFTKVAQFAIVSDDMMWILYPNKGHYLKSTFGINFLHLLLLKELGIIAVEDLSVTFKQAEHPTERMFRNGNKIVILRKETGSPDQSLRVVAFTRVGKELLNLIEVVPNQQYLEKLASLLKHEGSEVIVADFLKEEGGRIHFKVSDTF